MGSPRRLPRLFASAIFAILLAVIAAGCASTRITSEWKDPSLARLPLQKVLAVFQTPDAARRRQFEDRVAREFPNAIASYTVIRDEELRNLDRVKQRVRDLGFDALLIMRVTAVERQQTYVPPASYMRPVEYVDLWGYWNFGWAQVYEPGYLRTDRVVKISTTLYSLPDDTLVFASESESFDPASLEKAVAETAKVVAKAVRETRR
jgi:hypothetical protein